MSRRKYTLRGDGKLRTTVSVPLYLRKDTVDAVMLRLRCSEQRAVTLLVEAFSLVLGHHQSWNYLVVEGDKLAFCHVDNVDDQTTIVAKEL